jgi:hypothetical protein
MAISTALCNVAKRDFLNGVHQSGHSYRLALIKTGHAGTYGAATTDYSLGTDECDASGSYSIGGLTLTGYTAALVGGVGSLDWGNPQATAFTGSADGALLYNDSAAGKPAIAVFAFANAPVAATNGTLDITIPTSGTGVIRFT